MGMHTGDLCFFCKKKLREDDDVVVCPECGTPYHRACWNQNGACVNLPLHASGGSWQKEPALENSSRICPNCGTKNDSSAKHCQNCGTSLEEPLHRPSWQNSAADTAMEPREKHETFRERMQRTAEQMGMEDPYGAMDPEERLGEARMGDMADFVASNQLYYLPKFIRFSHENRRISLNCPCLLFPHLYFAYRKMWPLALILAGVFALIQLPQTALALLTSLPDMIASLASTEDNILIAMYPNAQEILQNMLDRLETHTVLIQNMVTICNYLDLCLSLIFGLLGNWFYYRHVQRRVEKICKKTSPGPIRRMRLRQGGGTNGWLILAAIAVEYVAVMLLTMILMLVLMA